ncbi:MAG TPA: hypothetical protein VGG50_06740 [Streptosporangiaceae bacterium]
MNTSLAQTSAQTSAQASALTLPACQAGSGCRRSPCLRIQLPGGQSRGRSALACGAHLGEVARDLAAWARGHGFIAGQVTVLAIDPRGPGAPGGQEPGRPGIVVGSFPLVNPGGPAGQAGRGPLPGWRP